MGKFDQRPLIVIGLGGNALSPPAGNDQDYQQERDIIARTGQALKALADQGARLLIVHGNGPQVGRLLNQDPAHANLDIHIAQTQGELGYLLQTAAQIPMVTLLTTVVVAEEDSEPEKPIGPILINRPEPGTPAARTNGGWRALVESPHPQRIVESAAIRTLLAHQHVIAGGGGGIPLTEDGRVVQGVIDKDRLAALLAVEMSAKQLILATNVDHVYNGFGSEDAAPIDRMSTITAMQMVAAGAAPAGSMGPKLEAAAAFANASDASAVICHVDDIVEATQGEAGTLIRKYDQT